MSIQFYPLLGKLYSLENSLAYACIIKLTIFPKDIAGSNIMSLVGIILTSGLLLLV